MVLENIQDNLVAFWRMNEEGSSLDRVDAVAGNFDGVVSGSIGDGVGKIDGACDFTGGLLTCGGATDLHLSSGDFTIAGWFKVDTFAVADMGIISKYTFAGNQKQWGLWLADAPDHLLWIRSYDGQNITGVNHGATLVIDTWYFFVVDYRASDNRMRVNVNEGTEATATDANDGIFEGSGVPRIGVQNLSGGDFIFNGLIDELGIWERLWTDLEKTEVFNGGDGVNIFTGTAAASALAASNYYYGRP